jgi:NhaP-type Na+/H+ or K+/H+ antiporter
VSLAAALSLPTSFPERDLIIFLTFVVILVTLVGQGLTLPLLVQRFGLRQPVEPRREEAEARAAVIQAGLAEIERLRSRWQTHQPLFDRLQAGLDDRSSHLATDSAEETAERRQERQEHEEIQTDLIQVQRNTLIQLRDDGQIDDDVLRVLLRELDLEELRMEA